MADSNKYGSMEEGAAAKPEDTNYEETYDTHYIVSTAEERRRKCINGCFPVVIFVLLMGTIVYALSRDFAHLYPWSHAAHEKAPSDYQGGGSSGVVSTPSKYSNSPYRPHNTHPNTHPHLSGNAGESHAACSLNSQCDVLGLRGDCCPTSAGVQLACCS